MKLFEHKGRILRTACLIAALAVTSLTTTKVAASDCTDQCAVDELACEAGCHNPGRLICLANCRTAYRDCLAGCP